MSKDKITPSTGNVFADLGFDPAEVEIMKLRAENMLQIEQIKEVIVHEYQPDKIILFGSRARHDARPDSDIDILVLSDREKDLPPSKRGRNLRLKLAKFSMPLDILFYTHLDFNRFRMVPQSFCSTIDSEGIVLYG